jgi:hypothetical protein
MARRGDGIHLRGKTWWLDFRPKTVTRELASVKWGAALKREVGIGGTKRRDLSFEKASELFLEWAKANKRPKTTLVPCAWWSGTRT